MVCAGTPNNASMVNVYAPAWTQWNNESKVTIHAPAWTRVVVCTGTPNNASMASVYAPAWTTVVVCAGRPHKTLRVTIHAPAGTKVLVCVCTPSVTICDVYRRRTRVLVERYVVHRHVMCIVTRGRLDTRVFPLGGLTALLCTGTLCVL